MWLLFSALGFLAGQILAGIFVALAAAVDGHLPRSPPSPTDRATHLVHRLHAARSVGRLLRVGVAGLVVPVAPSTSCVIWVSASAGATCWESPSASAGQILVVLMYIPIAHHVHDFSQRFDAPNQRLTGGSHGTGYMVIAVLTVVGAPFFEELFFRGVLLRALARLFGRVGGWVGPSLAIVVTGVLFGLAHAESLQLLGLATFGIIFSSSPTAPAGLGMNMVAHATFNLMAPWPPPSSPRLASLATPELAAEMTAPVDVARPAAVRRRRRRRPGRPPVPAPPGAVVRAHDPPLDLAGVGQPGRWRGVTLVALSQLHPSLLVANTTTAGGDTGAHVMLPAFLKSHLLTHGQVTGWDPDWYDGFPLYTFYFPLPGLITVLFNAVVSYDVAFKLVTVLGSLTLPLCAWAFGRLAGLRDPGPGCLAAATLPFLFEPSFSIYGGNILSTLAGEYSFSLSLSLSLLFLGVWATGYGPAATGPWRRSSSPSPCSATCCPRSSPRPARRSGCSSTPTWSGGSACGRRGSGRPSSVVPSAGLVGGGRGARRGPQRLVAPALRHRSGLHHQHGLHEGAGLSPPALPGVGPLGAGRRPGRPRGHGGPAQPGGAVHSGDGRAVGRGWSARPGRKLYNARFLPFWFLCLYLLAGYALAESVAAVARWHRRRRLDQWVAVGASASAVPREALAARCASAASAGPLRRGCRRGGGGTAGGPGRRVPGGGPSPGAAGLGPEPGGGDRGGRPAELLGRLELLGLRAQARLSGVPRRDPDDGQGGGHPGVRTGHVGVRPLGEPLRHHHVPDAAPVLDRTAASIRWRACSSNRRRPRRSTSSTRTSCRSTRPTRWSGLPYGGLNVPLGIQHLQQMGVRYFLAASTTVETAAAADPAPHRGRLPPGPGAPATTGMP